MMTLTKMMNEEVSCLHTIGEAKERKKLTKTKCQGHKLCCVCLRILICRLLSVIKNKIPFIRRFCQLILKDDEWALNAYFRYCTEQRGKSYTELDEIARNVVYETNFASEPLRGKDNPSVLE